MPVILPQESRSSATIDRPTTAYLSSSYLGAWRLLGWLGIGFFAMSMIDIILGWYPLRLGTPEWEFGTVSASMAALSIPTLSLYLVLGSAISLERPRIAKAIGIGMILLALVVLAMAALYVTTVPLALKAVATNDVASLNMKKAILKWAIMFTGYETLYVVGAVNAFRRRSAV